MRKEQEEEYLSDEEIEALLREPDSMEEDGQQPPIYQRNWLKKGIGFLLVLMLLGNILAFWPKVYSMAAIQFLSKSAQLYQNEAVQAYKDAVVVVKADQSKGTGFNIKEDGLIVTNYHVVEGARGPIVHFADGNSYETAYIAGDPELDIALLKIEDASELPMLTLADKAAATGTPFFVIGNPLFFYRIANEGELIGWHPVISPRRLMLAAPIYKGNSGSPVISHDGQVLGVVYATTTVSTDTGRETVGLAIPIEHVHAFMEEQGVK